MPVCTAVEVPIADEEGDPAEDDAGCAGVDGAEAGDAVAPEGTVTVADCDVATEAGSDPPPHAASPAISTATQHDLITDAPFVFIVYLP